MGMEGLVMHSREDAMGFDIQRRMFNDSESGIRELIVTLSGEVPSEEERGLLTARALQCPLSLAALNFCISYSIADGRRASDPVYEVLSRCSLNVDEFWADAALGVIPRGADIDLEIRAAAAGVLAGRHHSLRYSDVASWFPDGDLASGLCAAVQGPLESQLAPVYLRWMRDPATPAAERVGLAQDWVMIGPDDEGIGVLFSMLEDEDCVEDARVRALGFLCETVADPSHQPRLHPLVTRFSVKLADLGFENRLKEEAERRAEERFNAEIQRYENWIDHLGAEYPEDRQKLIDRYGFDPPDYFGRG